MFSASDFAKPLLFVLIHGVRTAVAVMYYAQLFLYMQALGKTARNRFIVLFLLCSTCSGL